MILAQRIQTLLLPLTRAIKIGGKYPAQRRAQGERDTWSSCPMTFSSGRQGPCVVKVRTGDHGKFTPHWEEKLKEVGLKKYKNKYVVVLPGKSGWETHEDMEDVLKYVFDGDEFKTKKVLVTDNLDLFQNDVFITGLLERGVALYFLPTGDLTGLLQMLDLWQQGWTKRAHASLAAAYMASDQVQRTEGGQLKAPSAIQGVGWQSNIIETLDDERYQVVTRNTYKWSVVGCKFDGSEDGLAFAHALGKEDATDEEHPGLTGIPRYAVPENSTKPWHEMTAEEIHQEVTMFGKSTAAFTKEDNDALKEKLKPPPVEDFDRRQYCKERREGALRRAAECVKELGLADVDVDERDLRDVYNWFMNQIVAERVAKYTDEVIEEYGEEHEDIDEADVFQKAAKKLRGKKGFADTVAGKALAQLGSEMLEESRCSLGKDGERQKKLNKWFDFIGKAKEHDAAAKKAKEEKEKEKAKKKEEKDEKEKEKAEKRNRKEEKEKEKAATKAKEKEKGEKAQGKGKETGGKKEKEASKDAEIHDHMLLPAGEVAEVTSVVKGKLELCLRGGGAMCTPDFALCPDCAESALTKEKAKAKREKKAEEKEKAEKAKKEKEDKKKKKEEAEKKAKAEKEKKEKEERDKKKEKEEAEKRAKAEKEKKEKEKNDKQKKEEAEKAKKEKEEKDKKEKEEAEKRAKAEKEKKEKEEKDKKKREAAEKAKKEKEERGRKDKEKAEETCPLGHRLKTMTKADLKAEGHDATFQCDACKEKPHNIVEATKRGAKVCVRADIDHDWGRCGKCAPEAQEAKPAAKAPEQGFSRARDGKKAPKEEKAPKGGKKKAQKGKKKE
eukprot:gene3492-60881_t